VKVRRHRQTAPPQLSYRSKDLDGAVHQKIKNASSEPWRRLLASEY
jgi:hypothetical protein